MTNEEKKQQIKKILGPDYENVRSEEHTSELQSP